MSTARTPWFPEWRRLLAFAAALAVVGLVAFGVGRLSAPDDGVPRTPTSSTTPDPSEPDPSEPDPSEPDPSEPDPSEPDPSEADHDTH